MKKNLKTTLVLLFAAVASVAQNVEMTGPDGRLRVKVVNGGETGVSYSVTYDGKQMVNASPLGLETNIGDFSNGLTLVKHETAQIDTTYRLTRIKTSQVHYRANELVCHLSNAEGKPMLVTFRISDNDVAFRYTLPREGETGSVRVMEEKTGFSFPVKTTTFLCPQSDAMIGWKRTKPSY